jgi:hypothetical protein
MKIYGWFFFALIAPLAFVFSGIWNTTADEPAISDQRGVTNQIINTPICLDRSNIPLEEIHWLYLPTSPEELSTREYYSYLAGGLIRSGAIDASECPLNGLWPNGYATACGLEKTREASIYLQNVYDDEILAAGREVGVPPVMFKQLIRYESQFWPLRMDMFHQGLGHVTYLGAINGLRWNPYLYAEMCQQVYGRPCENSLFSSGNDDILLAAHLMNLLDPTCPDCEYKIDIPKAEKSISYLAQILMGYCRQTSQIVYNASEVSLRDTMDYATIWKLSLLNYNAGPSCVYDMVWDTFDPDNPKKLTWQEISAKAKGTVCVRGVLYVNNITQKYYNFNTAP